MIAADWHYNAKGESFYSQHLLADKVADGFGTILDELRECHYLGEMQSVPPTAGEETENALAVYKAAQGESFAEKLKSVLLLASAQCEQVAREGNIAIGTKAILDEISKMCYVNIGLIARTLAK